MNKLVELELVVKERGNYRLEREVKVGVLKQFIKIGTFLLPRYVLYATMFTILLIFFLTQLGQRGLSFYSNFALILAILSTVIAWYETIRVWMQKP